MCILKFLIFSYLLTIVYHLQCLTCQVKGDTETYGNTTTGTLYTGFSPLIFEQPG